jgi:hypothetical protein
MMTWSTACPALTHYLPLQVAGGELVSAIPSNAQKDDCRLEVLPLEGRFILLQEDNSRRVMAELER